ncbi:MAG: monovalent cation/H(+) antiporter subunit G [Nitratireductor sp.]
MTIVATFLAGILIIVGSFFALTAALGLVRLPDVYSRMHAASKAGTMGSGLMMIALALVADDLATVTRAVAGLVFFLLTAPIAAHLLAKAAYSVGYKLWEKSVLDEMSDR